MNWRKRKRLRRIANNHGCDHFYKWKRKLKSIVNLKPFYDKLFSAKTELEKQTAWNNLMIKINRPGYMIFTKQSHDEFLKSIGVDVNLANQLREEFLASFCNAVKIPIKFLDFQNCEDYI